MPLFLTRRDREIIAEQESLSEAKRMADEARQRDQARLAEDRREFRQRMDRKEIEWKRIKAEIDPPLRDLPYKTQPFRSNKDSICGNTHRCSCGHNCDSRCVHRYAFGEIVCKLCGEKLGA